LNAEKEPEAVAMRTFESLARRGASWFTPRPRGDLFAAWMKAVRKRNKGEIPPGPLALWELSVDVCNLMEREVLERERLFQTLGARGAPELDLSDRVRALEDLFQRTTEADPLAEQLAEAATATQLPIANSLATPIFANPATQISQDRRAEIDAFIGSVLEKTGKRITRTDIWRVAGYSDATQFERFQRNQNVSKGSLATFGRVLRLSPAEFLVRLNSINPR
jgi:hypothetical protein